MEEQRPTSSLSDGREISDEDPTHNLQQSVQFHSKTKLQLQTEKPPKFTKLQKEIIAERAK